MKISEKGKKLLAQWEGYKKKVYKDSAGKLTIGVGHLLTQKEISSGQIVINGEPVSYKNCLTDENVIDLLGQDLIRFEQDVDRTIKVSLNQNQFDALVSFAFNVGDGAFSENIGVVRVLNKGLYEAVPDELRKWRKAGGKVVTGLVNRRENEIKLWNGQL